MRRLMAASARSAWWRMGRASPRFARAPDITLRPTSHRPIRNRPVRVRPDRSARPAVAIYTWLPAGSVEKSLSQVAHRDLLGNPRRPGGIRRVLALRLA